MICVCIRSKAFTLMLHTLQTVCYVFSVITDL